MLSSSSPKEYAKVCSVLGQIENLTEWVAIVKSCKPYEVYRGMDGCTMSKQNSIEVKRGNKCVYVHFDR